jgi:isopentenyl diphosphate isomerase/L-lactate dehydrogenase-like FMN-dependent dehydrogenase
MNDITTSSRRQFLRFLTASPLASALSGVELVHGADIVADPAAAVDIFDLEATARANIPTAHWGYLATGVNDDSTLHANREAFGNYYVRSRRLVGVDNIDTSIEILGQRWPTPIIMAPLGSQRAFHAEGELGSARAAKSRNHLQILSTVSSTSVEAVAEARDAPVWFQLYTMGGWAGVRSRLRRAEAAGCPVVVLTVDMAGGTDARHTLMRAIKADSRDCAVCHEGDGIAAQGKPMLEGADYDAPEIDLTWEFLDRLKQDTTMQVFVKGIVTAEDAARCLERGADGIIVSNHGGRADDSGRGTLDSLAEVAPVVQGRVPLFMDSGIRRGVDIFKALALGADAIMIGRPYIWGLGSFGQQGVERALDILTAELKIAMQSFGTPRLADIGPANIGRG